MPTVQTSRLTKPDPTFTRAIIIVTISAACHEFSRWNVPCVPYSNVHALQLSKLNLKESFESFHHPKASKN